ncbi:hypothetical protein DFH28DRAFT_931088 [Melampsora americana]|nr:hypothetical protein DFH28DRAFT_931088 [Melampsora americana]
MSKPNTRKGNQSNKKEVVVNMLIGPQVTKNLASGQGHQQGIEGRDQSGQTNVNDQGTVLSNSSSITNEHGELQTNQTKVNDSGVQSPSSGSNVPKEVEKNVELDKGVDKTLDKSYLSSLGAKPTGTENLDETVIIIDKEHTINLEDKDEVFNKAMEMVIAGKTEESAKYMKIYQALRMPENRNIRPLNNRNNSSLPRVESDRNDDLLRVDKTVMKRTSSENPIIIDDGNRDDGGVFEGGMWFFEGKTTDTNNLSYTPYFDRNIRELRYPIPLTIFSKEWQNSALSYHAKKKVKSEDKLESYTGIPYPDEWLQSYGEWSLHYIGFVAALRSIGLVKFPEWAEMHKKNVEKIVGKYGWMTALKYDINIRSNALINRVVFNGKVAPPDISKYDEVVVEECFTDARVKGELFGIQNPYREGGEREGWNPATGKPPEKKPFQKQQQQQRYGQALANASGSGEFKNIERKRFKPGYQGNNFDPKYAEKKAAMLAAKGGGKEKGLFFLKI